MSAIKHNKRRDIWFKIVLSKHSPYWLVNLAYDKLFKARRW